MRLPRAHEAHAWLLGLVSVGAVVAMTVVGAGADTPAIPGSQGTDTALPATESVVTVRGRGAFANLEITVNQTENLSNQAISITWSGAAPTRPGPGDWGANFLQVMQCWGDDDGSVPGNPGPPPEQCQYGASSGSPTFPGGPVYPNGYAMTRVITKKMLPNFDPAVGVLDQRTGEVWRPFRAVDGTVITSHYDPDFNPQISGGSFWLNPYFNIITTNELAAARTGINGRGSDLFEVQTSLEAPGLGCGQRTVVAQDGSKVEPRCWLVIVPRGEPVPENAGMIEIVDNPATPGIDESAVVSTQRGVISSPLAPVAWQNRIAIPLEFKSVDSPCDIAADSRRIAGSELLQLAVSSWHPALCTGSDLPTYSYATIGDSAARQQIVSAAAGGPGLAVVSRPLTVQPADPVVYTPLGVGGVVIGFNLERIPKIDAPEAAQQLAGVRVGRINLTPRLVAKLLTQSYRTQVEIGSSSPSYPWVPANPRALGDDPDFLRFNPEFTLLQSFGRLVGGLQLPVGNSDAALQVWEWVLADPEAAAWLGGTPDEWGMRVNPAYATSAANNVAGVAFGDPIPNSFPKADPYCYQPAATSPEYTPPQLCGTDWMPYARSFAETAALTRAGNDTARIVPNPTSGTASGYWRRDVPQPPGSRAMMAITDTANAARLGLQVAHLSRAGDNDADREFIAPNLAGLDAGVAAMRARSEPTVLEPAPQVQLSGAYPLTSIAYGVTRPLALSAQARSDFAAFVEYAISAGQVSGPLVGQLPPGYLPLPAALQQRAGVALSEIRTVTAPTTTTTTVRPVVSTTIRPVTFPTYRPTGGGSSNTVPTATTTAPVDETTTTTTEVIDESEESSSTTSSSAPVDTTSPTTTIVPVTASVDAPGMRLAVAGLGVVAIGSALGALELTKRARRAPDSGVVPLPGGGLTGV